MFQIGYFRANLIKKAKSTNSLLNIFYGSIKKLRSSVANSSDLYPIHGTFRQLGIKRAIII